MKIDKRKTYGLALGGGAARGLAHIGVLKNIEKQKIKIGEISGTSMGAIVGAMFAIGLSSKKIEKFALELNIFKMVDFDLKRGLIGGGKVVKKIEELIGDTLIEDSKIPLKIVATKLSTGERVIFTTGKIKDALRASMSLPGIIKPHEIDGSLYVDGGICCNLPIEVLESEDVIAISALKEPSEEIEMTTKIFGFTIKRGFLPLSYDILHKTILVMMAQNENNSLRTRSKNVLFFRPSFGKFDYYSFNKTKEIIDMGYKQFKDLISSEGKNK